MVDSTDILEAALSALDEAILVLDEDSRVLFWNHAATGIAGYTSSEMIGRGLPDGFNELDALHDAAAELDSGGRAKGGSQHERPVLVHLCHQQGHRLPVKMHRMPLRTIFGKRCGTLLRFHPAEEADSLSNGENCYYAQIENRIEHAQADLEVRLDEASRDWMANAMPYGVMWILVDQAGTLRKTHGRDAFEAMTYIVEKTLLHGLKPAELLGRWGSEEFLVLSHDGTLEMLDAHGRYLAGLTRTADFRWWGDRVGLTVSIGVAQAETCEPLSSLLKRAQKAMKKSQYSGGNRVSDCSSKEMADTGGQECSQS